MDGVARVRGGGVVPGIATPRAGARQRRMPEDVVGRMAEAGLYGIEGDHRDHDEAGRADVDRLAARLGLAITGSSDYHGTGKPNRLGENTTDPAVIDGIVSQGTLDVVHP